MLGFIFDAILLEDENHDFYGINLNYRLWQDRYSPIFGKLIYATRAKKCPKQEIPKAYTIANGKDVSIQPVYSYRSVHDVFLRRRKIKNTLRATISQCDKVIVRLPSPLGNLACDVCRELHKPYAIEMVACAWDGYNHHGHWAGRLVAPYMLLATRRQCRKASRVLYVTKHFLQHRYPTHGKTTNASNVLINAPKDAVLKKRIKKIQQHTGDYKIGVVGRLELESKGQAVAIKAISRLVHKYPNIKLELLGVGEGAKLKALVKKLHLEQNVVFKGSLPSGEPVLNWMDSLDILAIPSYQEGLPRALIEAMSRGCPAVGSRAGGIPELLDPTLLHRPGDYKKLARDLDKVLSNKDLAAKLAADNFRTSKEYAKEQLDERRNNFWKEFANE